jgi:hypothetical protein
MPVQPSSEKGGVSSIAAAVAQCREFITQSAPDFIRRYLRENDLQPQIPDFEDRVVQAILSSVVLYLDRPNRKRFSVLGKELARVDKAASAAAKSMRRLQIALDNLTPVYRDAVFKRLEMPIRTALHLDTLSNSAAIRAKACKRFDKGGGSNKMLEFAMLVRGLVEAFEMATGRAAKVTLNQHNNKYEGRFVNLVETMLPLAQTCAEKFRWQIPCPSSQRARGKYIYEATRSGRAMPRTRHHSS